jgi:hypothetical protein
VLTIVLNIGSIIVAAPTDYTNIREATGFGADSQDHYTDETTYLLVKTSQLIKVIGLSFVIQPGNISGQIVSIGHDTG